MFEHKKINTLDDFFMNLSDRPGRGVYFYRINNYTSEIAVFIKKYYQEARKAGVIIEGRIPNPDQKNLDYYEEIMGINFQLNIGFLTSSLKKWLPRMDDQQRNNVAASIYDSLDQLRQAGKNENILKNAYIKFMCWLYYKFERIVNLLGENNLPKILYEGEISHYELLLISILSNAGCDVVLLQYSGDQPYRKVDPTSIYSDELSIENGKAFPPNYNLKFVLNQIQEDFNNARLYGHMPSVSNCTNAWISGNVLADMKQPITTRGNDPKLYYNCFCRINGVEDKLTYVNDLYQLFEAVKSNGRKVVVIDGEIPNPTPEEIAEINRNNYLKLDQMLMGLTSNIKYSANVELQRLMVKAFLDVLLDESKKENETLNRITNKAVYLICWLKRYQVKLFSNWKMSEISCFIHMGACKNETAALFLKVLARLPIDVLILNPNRNERCCLVDDILFEQNFVDSLTLTRFPQENSAVHMGTAAFHAERELDTLMYQDSGLYRNHQYQKANAISLQTMYEEIRILWDQDLKFRPNFSTAEELVNLPVIFAKVSGVKDRNLPQYWSSIKDLITEDTFVVNRVPFLESTMPNQMKAHATEFYKNGRLQIRVIKNHPKYQYGFLREGMQDHILDKLQVLIEQKLIRGTFENGTEYTIVSTVLNLPKEILRMIQKFDFTKKNPKLIYINTGEKIISLEDSILVAFLNLVGFDIVFFVPTGYQNIEKYFNRKLVEEHQIGDYMYDLQVPNMISIPSTTRPKSWRDKLFGRES